MVIDKVSRVMELRSVAIVHLQVLKALANNPQQYAVNYVGLYYNTNMLQSHQHIQAVMVFYWYLLIKTYNQEFHQSFPLENTYALFYFHMIFLYQNVLYGTSVYECPQQ